MGHCLLVETRSNSGDLQVAQQRMGGVQVQHTVGVTPWNPSVQETTTTSSSRKEAAV
jgi:hypothetical protein